MPYFLASFAAVMGSIFPALFAPSVIKIAILLFAVVSLFYFSTDNILREFLHMALQADGRKNRINQSGFKSFSPVNRPAA
jgi:hypothetical protein